MLSVSTFGSFGCGSVAPLVSGLYTRPVDAVFNVIGSAALASGLASMGSMQLSGWQAQTALPMLMKHLSGGGQTLVLPACDQMLITMVVSPAFWITVACWILAAAACSAISGDKGKVRAVVGVLVGACFIAAGLVLQTYLATNGAVYMPGQGAITVVVIVTAISLVFAALRK